MREFKGWNVKTCIQISLLAVLEVLLPEAVCALVYWWWCHLRFLASLVGRHSQLMSRACCKTYRPPSKDSNALMNKPLKRSKPEVWWLLYYLGIAIKKRHGVIEFQSKDSERERLFHSLPQVNWSSEKRRDLPRQFRTSHESSFSTFSWFLCSVITVRCNQYSCWSVFRICTFITLSR